MTFTPVVKQPGDLAKASEWNDAVAEIVRLGKHRVKSMRFEPTDYWKSRADDDVEGFSLTMTTPVSGTLVVYMNALVRMDVPGRKIYLGPKINNQIDHSNRGGIRAPQFSDIEISFPPPINDVTIPSPARTSMWVGTAAFNTRSVSAGEQVVQVHADLDIQTIDPATAVAQVAWGSLVAMFFPD